MKTTIQIIVIVLLAVNQFGAYSQTIINNDETVNSRAYVRTGIEPASNLSLGFEHNFGHRICQKPNVYSIETGLFKKGFELKIGDRIPLFEKKSFKIINK